MSDEKVKVFTGSGSFNIQDEMLKDSKDLLDNVAVSYTHLTLPTILRV